MSTLIQCLNVNNPSKKEVNEARTAEIANQYLRKGSKVLVEGRLVLEQWVAQDGTKRSRHSITVETMQMLDSRADSMQQNSGYNAAPNYQQTSGQQSNYMSQPAQQVAPQMPQEPEIPEIDIDEDEIPF